MGYDVWMDSEDWFVIEPPITDLERLSALADGLAAGRITDDHPTRTFDTLIRPELERRGILPDSYCPWFVTEDGATLMSWEDESCGRGYAFEGWLAALCALLRDWGHKVNGEARWEGEDRDDVGKLIVKDNELSVAYAEFVFGEPEPYGLKGRFGEAKEA